MQRSESACTTAVGTADLLRSLWRLQVTSDPKLPPTARVSVGVGIGRKAESSLMAEFQEAAVLPQYVCSAWSSCNASCKLLASEGTAAHKLRNCTCFDPRDPNGTAVAGTNTTACEKAGVALAPVVSECTMPELGCGPVVYRIHPSRSVVGDTVSIIGRAFGQSAAHVLSVRLGVTECYTSAWVSSSIVRCQVPIADRFSTFRVDVLGANATIVSTDYVDQSFADHVGLPPPLLRITAADCNRSGSTPLRPDSVGVYYEERVDFPQMSEAFAFVPQVRTYLRTPRRRALNVTYLPQTLADSATPAQNETVPAWMQRDDDGLDACGCSEGASWLLSLQRCVPGASSAAAVLTRCLERDACNCRSAIDEGFDPAINRCVRNRKTSAADEAWCAADHAPFSGCVINGVLEVSADVCREPQRWSDWTCISSPVPPPPLRQAGLCADEAAAGWAGGGEWVVVGAARCLAVRPGEWARGKDSAGSQPPSYARAGPPWWLYLPSVAAMAAHSPRDPVIFRMAACDDAACSSVWSVTRPIAHTFVPYAPCLTR